MRTCRFKNTKQKNNQRAPTGVDDATDGIADVERVAVVLEVVEEERVVAGLVARLAQFAQRLVPARRQLRLVRLQTLHGQRHLGAAQFLSVLFFGNPVPKRFVMNLSAWHGLNERYLSRFSRVLRVFQYSISWRGQSRSLSLRSISDSLFS